MEGQSIAIYGSAQEPHMAFVLRNNPQMDITEQIARNLSSWMNESTDLKTLKDVVKKSGVGFGTVRRARNGDGNITVQNLAAIAAAFRRSAVDLIRPTADYRDASPPVSLCVQEPPAEERELLHGYRDAEPAVRAIMLDAARRATRDKGFTTRSEQQ